MLRRLTAATRYYARAVRRQRQMCIRDGHYAHRHRAGAGFGHPSVYCADQQRFLHHVAAALARATGTGPARDPTTAGEGGTR
ncbi:hypothetical protein [Streptomyces albidoflavus]|uniref:hypothetical protein n=1 Tax=Streptomyces albidoflavus TaxID=1886 RepID=UPI003529B0C8